jgi:transcriptional regulator with AAA-type ATPase domain
MPGALFTKKDRAMAECISRLSLCNPFLPERIACERQLLGDAYDERVGTWNLGPRIDGDDPNVDLVVERATALAQRLRLRLDDAARAPSQQDLQLYEDVVLLVLYYRFHDDLRVMVERAAACNEPAPAPFYPEFRRVARELLALPGGELPALRELGHVFACLYQIRRAFHHIYFYLVGVSEPTARLRAAVWESIFSHDLRRYRVELHARMADYATLIHGPSGSGKELIARAIGFSRYIPFRERERCFSEDFHGTFHVLNLAALAPTLVESELFGHRRGAFTGASGDRQGWFEQCPPLGTVFLDEIGELEPQIQVKLLRVLQSRTFQRLGETRTRRFQGKVIAATNRDLAGAIDDGAFREDLFYRLCGDQIEVPSLRDRVRSDPRELGDLLRFLANRELGEHAEDVAAEAERWIHQHLGVDYPWPGNVRELEQCLRNFVLRRRYTPRARRRGRDELPEAVARGDLTAAELLRRYVSQVFVAEGCNLEAAARRLELDRRTVRRHVDPDLLQRSRSEQG